MKIAVTRLAINPSNRKIDIEGPGVMSLSRHTEQTATNVMSMQNMVTLGVNWPIGG